MDVGTRQIGGENLSLWLVIFLGLFLSILTGFVVGGDAVTSVIVIFAVVLSIAWIVMARRRWWLIMAPASALGGYFWFGFKLYPHEVALLACFVPLLIARAVSTSSMIQRDRSHFPIAMYLLSGYLLAHWLGSNLYNRTNGQGGYGNVTRAYFNALWVILFLFAFRRFGSTKYMRAALALSYIAGLARVSMTLIFYVSRGFAYIPVINYIPPGATHLGASDLRTSGLAVAILAVCYFMIHKGFLRKSFHATIFLGSIVALFFGAGRTVIVLVCLVPVFAAVVNRKVIPVFVSILAIGSIVVALNINPAALDNVPSSVQRAASILLLNKAESAEYGRTETSDIWHARLRELGLAKWTQSWNTFLFGTGIRPFDYAMYEVIEGKSTMEDLLESSSKVGAYESGWWTVISVLGLSGAVLYLVVLMYLLRRLLPTLFKNKVRDHTHAFVFMAVFGIIVWFVLGWTSGSYPSTEIMFGFLALFALQDQKKRRTLAPIPHEPKVIQPGRAELAWSPAR